MLTEATRIKCSACDEIVEPEGPVYECSRCGGFQVDERRCDQCNIFMAKLAEERCPDCEATTDDGVTFDEVPVWVTEDGENHLSIEDAERWVAEAPERERKRAEFEAEQRERQAERLAEKQRNWERVEPKVARCIAMLDPEKHEELLRTLHWVNDLRFDAGLTVMVRWVEAMRLFLPDEPEVEAVFKAYYDRDINSDDASRRAIYDRAEVLTRRMRDRLPDDDRFEDAHHAFRPVVFTPGSGVSIPTEQFIDLMIEMLG